MAFSNNDVIEIACGQFLATARVRNVDHERLHVAIEHGYLPWTDDPIFIRLVSDPSVVVEARILHVSGVTAHLEIKASSTARMAAFRDTQTNEVR